jgi:hypothetical protein
MSALSVDAYFPASDEASSKTNKLSVDATPALSRARNSVANATYTLQLREDADSGMEPQYAFRWRPSLLGRVLIVAILIHDSSLPITRWSSYLITKVSTDI